MTATCPPLKKASSTAAWAEKRAFFLVRAAGVGGVVGECVFSSYFHLAGLFSCPTLSVLGSIRLKLSYWH